MAASDSVVGVGIFGTGLSASQHLAGIAGTANGRVVAIAGRSAEKAQALANQWRIPRVYGGIEELVSDSNVEVVHTCVPPDMRLTVVEACARAGKHVLIEKPMARTIAEADEIIAVCDRAGILLSALFQNRFTPLAKRLKQAVDNDQLGRILLVTLSAKWFRTAEYYIDSGWRGTADREGGAVLINQAIHSIDLLQWIMGPVAEISGMTATTLHPIEMEDTGVAMLRFASGAIGSIVATTVAYPGFSDRLEIHGERGTAFLIQGEGRLEWHLRGEEARIETASSQVSRGVSDPAATPSQGHSDQFTDFYAAIREGRPPSITGRDGRHALEIVEAIYQSSREGRPVKLPLQSARRAHFADRFGKKAGWPNG